MAKDTVNLQENVEWLWTKAILRKMTNGKDVVNLSENGEQLQTKAIFMNINLEICRMVIISL